MSDFENKVAVVTGAAKGIGEAIAEQLVKEGAVVFIADIDVEVGELLANHFTEIGGKVIFVPTDVSEPASIDALFGIVKSYYSKIDILVNNAGIAAWKSPFELTLENWDKIINTNLRSVFLCSREAAKLMPDGGAIVNIASTRAFMSEPHSEAYAASKGGIVALTHAMAASFAPYKIQVNCISPGWIETLNYDSLRKEDHEQHFSRRVGTPDDIARAVLFLANTANNFISGENLIIDGGMTKKMIYIE